MTNEAYERAFNVAIKYGFCFDCAWTLDKGRCHECDCYQNAVKVIRDALEKLDAIEQSKGKSSVMDESARTTEPKGE